MSKLGITLYSLASRVLVRGARVNCEALLWPFPVQFYLILIYRRSRIRAAFTFMTQ